MSLWNKIIKIFLEALCVISPEIQSICTSLQFGF